MQLIVHFDEAVKVAQKLKIHPAMIEIWVPRSEFVRAFVDDQNLSITRRSETFFGWAFGPNPTFDKDWRECAVTRSTPRDKTSHLKLISQWDAYGIETRQLQDSMHRSYEVLTDHDEINSLIEKNAPELSIRADDSEVVAWIGLRSGSLVALGALCQWESGFHVLSAIVVKTEERGRGLGRKITEALVDYAFKRERYLMWLLVCALKMMQRLKRMNELVLKS
jgi:ribosomal protein S18 acetylase RimI-like enzyme